MRDCVILHWKEADDKEFEEVAVLYTDSLDIWTIDTLERLEYYFGKDGTEKFLNNKDEYPYFDKNGKLINEDKLIAIEKIEVKNKGTVYLLSDYNGNLLNVSEEQIKDYKIANDINGIGVADEISKLGNYSFRRSVVIHYLPGNSLNLDFATMKVSPECFANKIEYITFDCEININKDSRLLQSLPNLKKITFNKACSIESTAKMKELEEIEFKGTFKLIGIDFVKQWPKLHRLTVGNIDKCEYPRIFSNVRLNSSIDINDILKMSGNHYIDGKLFYNYDAHGNDVIIPDNITEIDVGTFNTTKNLKDIYIYSRCAEFKTDVKKKRKEVFLDVGYPVTLHLNKYFLGSLSVGSNVTVIKDLESNNDKDVAKYLSTIGKSEYTFKDELESLTDENIKEIMDSLLDGEIAKCKNYLYRGKVLNIFFNVTFNIDIDSKNVKILRGKENLLLIYGKKVFILPYCKKDFVSCDSYEINESHVFTIKSNKHYKCISIVCRQPTSDLIVEKMLQFINER